jgi:nucleoside-diphosphate-sugar epimerase
MTLVLVTGIAGFTGLYVKHRLNHGFEIEIVDSSG